jgi:hypothetical protein
MPPEGGSGAGDVVGRGAKPVDGGCTRGSGAGAAPSGTNRGGDGIGVVERESADAADDVPSPRSVGGGADGGS